MLPPTPLSPASSQGRRPSDAELSDTHDHEFKLFKFAPRRRQYSQWRQRTRRGSDETDDDEDEHDDLQSEGFIQTPMCRSRSREMDTIRRCTSEAALRSASAPNASHFNASVLDLPPSPESFNFISTKTPDAIPDGRKNSHEHASNARRLFSHFNRSTPMPTFVIDDDDDYEEGVDEFDPSLNVRSHSNRSHEQQPTFKQHAQALALTVRFGAFRASKNIKRKLSFTAPVATSR